MILWVRAPYHDVLKVLFSVDLVHEIQKRRWLFTRSIEKVGLDRTERAGWLVLVDRVVVMLLIGLLRRH